MSSVLVALRRLRDDRAPALGLGVLVLVTATVFGIAPRLIDRVGDDALHGTVAAATAFQRNIALFEEDIIPADPTDPLKGVEAEGDRLAKRIPPAIRNLVGSRQTVVDSIRFAIQAATPDPSYVRFRIQPGSEDRIRYVTGTAPTAATESVDLPEDLRRYLPPDDTASPAEPVTINVLGASISTDAAAAIVKRVGDLIFLTADPRDPLSGRQPSVVAMRITGIYEIRDPADPFWYEDQSLNHVSVRSLGGDSKLIDIGAFLATAEYDNLLHSGQLFGIPIRTTWRFFIDPSRLSSARLDATIADMRRLETAFPQTQVTSAGTGAGTAMRSGLLPLLVGHQTRWASASAILTVVAIGPAAVALAALGLVATIAARRRRPALALVRGRGGTLGQMIRAVFLEGCVIAIPSLAVAILLAITLVPAGSNRPTIVAATVVAAAAVALLIATAMPGTTAAARGGREDETAGRGVSSRRLMFDLLVIVLAAGGAYLLRERGVRGSSSTGTLTGADPLIAAVPALAGIAAGLTAIRLVPIPLRAIGALARRGRGLIPMLALRRATQGGTTAAVLVVLLAAASIGAFSSAALVHLDRASNAAAWHAIGAPIRVTSAVGSLPTSIDPAKLPGVRTASALFSAFIQVGPRNVRVQLVAVDLPEYEAITTGTPADPAAPPEMLAAAPPGGVVPVLASASIVGRSDGVQIGQQLEIIAEGYHYPIKVVAARDTFPTYGADALFLLASRAQLKALHPDAPLAPTTMFLDAPDDQAAAITTAVTRRATSATVATRTAFASAFTDSPVTAAIVVGIAVAAIVAAVYAALAVTAALALAGASRATESAHLRMIGLSRRDALGLALIEHGPTVLLAFGAGVALGLGLFALLEPGLGIDAIVGSTFDVPLTADPQQLGLTFVVVLAIAIVGIGLAAWMQRRGSAVLALRRGFE
ncbi:MAG TPA: FtsX-like permease family protein [Candidatus Limnocylindrales bacterium]|nr:FtsX-like permease family protein [Candidatus Limnocylindrales bacterium]